MQVWVTSLNYTIDYRKLVSSASPKYIGQTPGKEIDFSQVEDQNLKKEVSFIHNAEAKKDKSETTQKTTGTQKDENSKSKTPDAQKSVKNVNDLLGGKTEQMGKDANALEEQIEKIRVVFLKIDNDSNGKVDIDEFSRFLKGNGYETRSRRYTRHFQFS